MKIGQFNDFKGGDVVLLDCDSQELKQLNSTLANFSESNDSELFLMSNEVDRTELVVELFLIDSSSTVEGSTPGSYYWACTKSEFPEISKKLLSLAAQKSGHQYFELQRSNVELVVSKDEYNAQWWCGHS